MKKYIVICALLNFLIAHAECSSFKLPTISQLVPIAFAGFFCWKCASSFKEAYMEYVLKKNIETSIDEVKKQHESIKQLNLKLYKKKMKTLRKLTNADIKECSDNIRKAFFSGISWSFLVGAKISAFCTVPAIFIWLQKIWHEASEDTTSQKMHSASIEAVGDLFGF